MIKRARLSTLIAVLFIASVISAGQLTPSEKRGKQIYLRGVGASGREITAVLSDGVEMPASVMTCGSCHGYDGQGRPEGGAIPSNVTWEALTKPYAIVHPDGREHPAYNERSLALAISAGIDPAGNPLSSPMPRYHLSREDMADLIAYLKRVGKDRDPGLTDASLTVGTILPLGGSNASIGEAIKALLSAYFDEINNQGGIYNRRIELRAIDCGAGGAQAKINAEGFLQKEQVFAMVSPYVVGADKEIAALTESEAVPLIGPVTVFPQTGFPINRYVFHLLPGLRDQARALVAYAKMKLGLESPRVAVVYSGDEVDEDAAAGIEKQSAGWNAITKIKLESKFDPSKVVDELAQKQIDVLFPLGSAKVLISLLREADKKKWSPLVLVPSIATGREALDALAGFRGKAFVSFPFLPSSEGMPSLMEYQSLAAKYRLSAQHIPLQVQAYCAARLFVETLRRAGREVSREKLIATLEATYEFNTGLIPPVSYGPNRRVGVMGAYIFAFDQQKRGWSAVSELIKLD